MISGFTYIHNALKAGIPIRESIKAVLTYVDEVVVVDAESNDGTREAILKMCTYSCQKNYLEMETLKPLRIIDAKWGTDGGETLKRLHAMNIECKGDVIVHFEADEVFDDKLISIIKDCYQDDDFGGYQVYRLQVEQNFQRIRWHPELVHRVFKKGTITKNGHTTNSPSNSYMPAKCGFLWDVTNCFRDNWLARVDQQAKLRSGTETPETNYRMVPLHFNEPIELTREQAIERLKEPHWTWAETPLNIPEILKPLVGRVCYG